MSSLEKLAIRGIRSFDPNELSVMQFYTPLTVIVGHNGSGKTTIIECLKYATTGDLPPNTKGGAFVHDPAIANEREVKAEVRLRFRNVNKERMVVTRRLQVSARKGGSHTMKTLEGTLSFADEKGDSNKRRSISTRAAELDEELPQQLGVSKAILESVIFCHQEDSNWPLSEPATLKKRFDDIFEATKYTKALTQIKDIRKEQAAEIKVDKERLVALKVDRERAKKLEQALDKIYVEINSKEAEFDQLDIEIKELYEANDQWYQGSTRYTEIINNVKTLNAQLDSHHDTVKSLQETMTLLPDSEEELQFKLNNFARHVADRAERLQAKQDELQVEESKIARCRSRLGHQQSNLGQAKAEERRYQDNLRDRRLLIEQLVAKHNLPGFDSVMDVDGESEVSQIQEIASSLRAEERKVERELEELRKRRKKDEGEKVQEIQNLRNKETSAVERRRGIKKQIDEVHSNIAKLQNKIDNSDVSESDLELREQALEDNKKRLQGLQDALAASKHDEQIRALQARERDAEGERDELLKEMSDLSKQSEARTKLGIKREERRTKEAIIAPLLQRHEAKFQKFVGQAPVASNMESQVNAVIREKEAELAGAERAATAINRDIAAAETKANFSKSRLSQLQSDLESTEKKLQELVEDGTTLSQALSEAEEEVSLRSRELEVIAYGASFHERLLKEARQAKACLACKRPVTDAELPALEKYCNDVIRGVPKRKREVTAELSDWQEEVTKLRNALPLEMSVTSLKTVDIPSVEADYNNAQTKVDAMRSSQEEAKKRVEELKSELSELQQLKRVASDVSRLLSEVKSVDAEIERLESELAVSGSIETLDDVQQKLDAVTERLRTTSNEIKSITADREKQLKGCHLLENTISRSEVELAKAKSILSEHQSWEDSKAEYKKKIQDWEQELSDLEANVREMAEPIRDLEDILAAIRVEYDQQEQEMGRSQNALLQSLQQLETATKTIAAYEHGGGIETLRQAQTAIEHLSKEIEQLETSRDAIKDAMSALEREEADADKMKRNYADNLRYRKELREIQRIKDEIEESGVDEAERAKRKFDEGYEASRKKQTVMQSRQATLGGEIATLKKSHEDKKVELATEYKDIKTEYRKQLIKVKIGEFSIQDLDKYGKALDSAIMKYHEYKMAEINDIVQELWTKTYQGTDIDKIMIKSDAEGAKGGRTYNYRVVMLKDQVEMDMRGRCSAGQKVLASIIIRLALAETFGTNCGVLALDEPTTNLDKDNITSLSKSLADIIRERRSQANFQLIVITHDEDLLSALSSEDVVDKFWRVSRNHLQKSQIARETLEI